MIEGKEPLFKVFRTEESVLSLRVLTRETMIFDGVHEGGFAT
jgi:hypothetical protein